MDMEPYEKPRVIYFQLKKVYRMTAIDSSQMKMWAIYQHGFKMGWDGQRFACLL